jgi:CDP-diacylglycerol--glycerol-3-phosphate 3-phosphatidyltransferase
MRPVSSRAAKLGYAAALSLTLLRVALGLPLLWIAMARASGTLAAALIVVGFVSDVYDGVVARRFGVATAGLRRLDSAADTVFYLAAAFAIWRLHPDSVARYRWLVVGVLATQILNHAFEIWKFGKEASYHAYAAKAWGLLLFVSMMMLLLFSDDRLLPVALVMGLVSHTENFIITLRLPEWQHDVKSIFAITGLNAVERKRLDAERSETTDQT